MEQEIDGRETSQQTGGQQAANDSDRIAFPILTPEQIRTIAPDAEPRAVNAGTVLVREGSRNFCFYIVQRGSVRITERSSGEEREITRHMPGEFTGDIDMLTGHRAFFNAIAEADTSVIELSGQELREVIRARSSVGDLLLNAFLMRRDLLLDSDFQGVRVIGSRWAHDTFRIRDFLARNHVPFTWLDLEQDEEVDALLDSAGVTPEETPIVLYGNRPPLHNPSNQELARIIGLTTSPADEVYDLAVIGAGPAGLAAAVYGASEGLNTLVIEKSAPGGQASWSSKIENYLGFPTGLSGSELAKRAVIQAEKFGVQMLSACEAGAIEEDGTLKSIALGDGEKVYARAVVIATGADYRRLPLDNLERYEGSSIFYSATAVEATMCSGQDVVIVGGGNSAGQAAVFLAERARCVHIFIRGDSLDSSMSRYLTQRIDKAENIHLVTRTEVTALHGEPHLERITTAHNQTGETNEYEVASLFVFIGAKPHTGWLDGSLELNRKGFIQTGIDVNGDRDREHSGANGSTNGAKNFTPRFMLETSMPGVFAAGDVRANSVKRVASAVGEGSMSVQFVHQVLAE